MRKYIVNVIERWNNLDDDLMKQIAVWATSSEEAEEWAKLLWASKHPEKTYHVVFETVGSVVR